MSTATALTFDQVDEILSAPEPGLHRCNVVRMNCGKCGEYTTYIAVDQKASPVCPNCGLLYAVVTAVARGWTKHELPWTDSKKPLSVEGHTTNLVQLDTKPRRAARGAPNKLSDAEIAEIRRLYDGGKGKTVAGIGLMFGVSRRTIWRALKEEK